MVAKKRGKKVSKKASKVESLTIGSVIASKKKFNLIVSNLLLFLIIFVVSLGLMFASANNEFYYNLFWMIALLTGFLSVALFIVYLVFLIMRYLGK